MTKSVGCNGKPTDTATAVLDRRSYQKNSGDPNDSVLHSIRLDDSTLIKTYGQKIVEKITKRAKVRLIASSSIMRTDTKKITKSKNGLTDCSSFVLMEELAINDVLTTDVHFKQMGRRNLML